MEYMDKLCEILGHYGINHQTIKLLEEFGELQTELTHFLDGRGDAERIAEELGDVEVLLDQISIAFDVTEKAAGFYCRKIDRQIERIRAEECKMSNAQCTMSNAQ